MEIALKLVIGVAIGAALGGLVGLLVRSSDKAWAFIRTPGRGAAFGAVVGFVFAYYFGTPLGWRPAEQSNVVVLTADTFDKTIAGERPVVVVFYTKACPTCHRLAPRIEKLADAYEKRVVVARVDAARESALADRFDVTVVPTLIYFGDGESLGAVEGSPSYSSLRRRVEKLLAEYPGAPKQTAPPESPTGKTAKEEATPPVAEPDADVAAEQSHRD